MFLFHYINFPGLAILCNDKQSRSTNSTNSERRNTIFWFFLNADLLWIFMLFAVAAMNIFKLATRSYSWTFEVPAQFLALSAYSEMTLRCILSTSLGAVCCSSAVSRGVRSWPCLNPTSLLTGCMILVNLLNCLCFSVWFICKMKRTVTNKPVLRIKWVTRMWSLSC